MDKYPDFWNVVIGSGPVGVFLGLIFIALVCAMVSLLIDSSNRNISSSNTPALFSWNFLVAANWKRILANLLALPILVRLTYEHLNVEANLFAAVGIGVVIDRAAMWLKNIGVLSSDKTAQRMNVKLAPDQPTVVEKTEQ